MVAPAPLANSGDKQTPLADGEVSNASYHPHSGIGGGLPPECSATAIAHRNAAVYGRVAVFRPLYNSVSHGRPPANNGTMIEQMMVKCYSIESNRLLSANAQLLCKESLAQERRNTRK